MYELDKKLYKASFSKIKKPNLKFIYFIILINITIYSLTLLFLKLNLLILFTIEILFLFIIFLGIKKYIVNTKKYLEKSSEIFKKIFFKRFFNDHKITNYGFEIDVLNNFEENIQRKSRQIIKIKSSELESIVFEKDKINGNKELKILIQINIKKDLKTQFLLTGKPKIEYDFKYHYSGYQLFLTDRNLDKNIKNIFDNLRNQSKTIIRSMLFENKKAEIELIMTQVDLRNLKKNIVSDKNLKKYKIVIESICDIIVNVNNIFKEKDL